jgi:hypothetical protein
MGKWEGRGASVLKRLRAALRYGLPAVAAIHLTACSKTVQWEEEVPLNNGQILWVARTVVYSSQGGAGNPLDTAYRPGPDQTIEFKWKGQDFRYKGDARLMLLAISPAGKPVLVAKAADNSWYARHNYACTLPFYAQLVPDDTGRSWTWPPRIEPWLLNLPANLMLSRHPPERMQRKYSAADRQAADGPGAAGNPSQQEIDPDYTGDLCRHLRK